LDLAMFGYLQLNIIHNTYLLFENKPLGALLAPMAAGAKSLPAVANVLFGTKCIWAPKLNTRLFNKLKAMSLRVIKNIRKLNMLHDVFGHAKKLA
jgi:hypothetical protein